VTLQEKISGVELSMSRLESLVLAITQAQAECNEVREKQASFDETYEALVRRLKMVRTLAFHDVRRALNRNLADLHPTHSARMLLAKTTVEFIGWDGSPNSGKKFEDAGRACLKWLTKLNQSITSVDTMNFWGPSSVAIASANVLAMQGLLKVQGNQFKEAADYLQQAHSMAETAWRGRHQSDPKPGMEQVTAGPVFGGRLSAEKIRRLANVTTLAQSASEIDFAANDTDLCATWAKRRVDTLLHPYLVPKRPPLPFETIVTNKLLRKLAKCLSRTQEYALALRLLHAADRELSAHRCISKVEHEAQGVAVVSLILAIKAALDQISLLKPSAQLQLLFGLHDSACRDWIGESPYFEFKMLFADSLAETNHSAALVVLSDIYKSSPSVDLRCDAMLRAIQVLVQNAGDRAYGEQLRSRIKEECSVLHVVRLWWFWDEAAFTIQPQAPRHSRRAPASRDEELKFSAACMKKVRNHDMYSFLGTTASATCSELKAAFRRAAIRLHPDKNGDECAQVHFLFLSDCFDRARKRGGCQGDVAGE